MDVSSRREMKDLQFITFEFLPGGNLFELVQKQGTLGEERARGILSQLIKVVDFIHSKGFVHLDLKLENVLLTRDEHQALKIKLCDFGFATDKNIHALTESKGTKSYKAPEIGSKAGYDGIKTDIFSLGVILFILVMGHFPFPEATKTDQFYRLLAQKDYSKYWSTLEKGYGNDKKISDSFKDLFQRMCTQDPKQRITLEEIKHHRWLAGTMNKTQSRKISTARKTLQNKETQDNSFDAKDFSPELTHQTFESMDPDSPSKPQNDKNHRKVKISVQNIDESSPYSLKRCHSDSLAADDSKSPIKIKSN